MHYSIECSVGGGSFVILGGDEEGELMTAENPTIPKAAKGNVIITRINSILYLLLEENKDEH